ncbi:threonine/serine dehydratase [Meiothermus taiwanensis]|uniref:L-threonine dehydratase catabolic TdcB n=1 Tax=Meiothermus taiwanensis TaxID=172827 RepID=A0A399E858_9DEIN|nr:threonine/serine dehydratase [Meiothermus taiwanensis]RIH80036.1 L-threonine dehydratase catabolic TdcB [Meiothermus taiwanensis]
MDWPLVIRQAHARLRPHVRETPLELSLALSQTSGAEVYLKLENLQHTASFKVRGALNKLLSLTPEQLQKGVVAASSGNHGAGVAFGLSKLGAQGIVFVPEGASPTKLEAIRRYGAAVRFYGQSGDDTEAYARSYAAQHGLTYISPYNDPEVIAGQGSLGVEIAQQIANPPDAVFVTVGGGGLVSGVAAYLKAVSPKVKIVGCQPENDAAMLASVRAGKIVKVEARPTLSDGSAGGLEPGAITLELCRTLVDDWVTVSEEEIRAAMRLFIETQHQLLEGAAGVALAAFLKQAARYRGQRVVVVICGANIGLSALQTVLC